MEWRDRYELELDGARRARQRGNEGQARVCARRAAGIVAVEYLGRRISHPSSSSAIDALNELLGDPSLPSSVVPLIDHLLQPVNADFKLPPGVDLIAEAARLRSMLLPE